MRRSAEPEPEPASGASVSVCGLMAVLLVVLSSEAARADGTSIRARRLADTQTEPWLHLDATVLDDAIGGVADGQATLFEIGPRTRLAVEGTWFQTGLAPSMFSTDLELHGWRASAELSYDLGPFRVGVNASMARIGDGSHRMVGLFAYRTFRLSRWMHAWIVLGISYEQWERGGTGPRQGANVGLSLGTTFR